MILPMSVSSFNKTVFEVAKPGQSSIDLRHLPPWVYFLVVFIAFLVFVLSCRESFNFVVAEKKRLEKERIAFLESVVFGQMDRSQTRRGTAIRAIRNIEHTAL